MAHIYTADAEDLSDAPDENGPDETDEAELKADRGYGDR